MKIYPKQKVNAFLAAIVSGLAGGMLSGGYAGLDDVLFARVAGLAILTAGLVQAYQDLLQDPPASGSSDLILGVGRAVLGGWLLLFPAQWTARMPAVLAGAVLFHGLYILQQAVLLRRARPRKAATLAGLSLVSLVLGGAMALLPDGLLATVGLALPLYADAGMLLATGFLLLFTLSDEEEALPAKKPRAKKPAAQKPVKAPQEQPAAANGKPAGTDGEGSAPPQDAPAPDEAAAEKEKPTEPEQAGPAAENDSPAAEPGESARAAAESERAEQARRAAARREKEEEQAAMSALQALGHMAGKAKKRAGQTAKNTVAGFKAGLRGDE